MGKWIPKKGKRIFIPLTISDDKIIPLTVDDSRVIPMTVDGEFEIEWEWKDEL